MRSKEVIRTVLLISCAYPFLLGTARSEDLRSYEFRGDLPPVRLSYTDLEHFVNDVDQLLPHGQGEVELIRPCSYQVKDQTTTLTRMTIRQILVNERLPSRATAFKFRCLYRNPNSSVYRFSISLSEYSRWEIAGTDRAVLETIRSRIEHLGQEHRVYFAGIVAQIATTVLAILLCVAAPIIYQARRRDIDILGALSIFLGMGVFLIFLFSEKPREWFPTVAFYKETASLLERHTAEICFWGLIILLIVSSPIIYAHQKKATAIRTDSKGIPSASRPPSPP